MGRQDIFWVENVLFICYEPIKFTYTYLILLKGSSVDLSTNNGAYVNLKIETLDTSVKPNKKFQIKL